MNNNVFQTLYASRVYDVHRTGIKKNAYSQKRMMNLDVENNIVNS